MLIEKDTRLILSVCLPLTLTHESMSVPANLVCNEMNDCSIMLLYFLF